MSMRPPPPAAVIRPPTPAGRLLATLGGAGAIAGLLIVSAYQWTLPRIERNKAERLQEAIGEVLGAPERLDTLYLVNGALTLEAPSGPDAARVDRIHLGYDSAGARIGFAIPAAGAGFQDVITLLVGYDPSRDRVLGMKVLGSKETPGLGDKIEKDSAFVREFRGATLPLVGVKAGAGETAADVDMITGATISSRAVIRIIDEAVARWRPLIEVHAQGGSP